ncbi:hypothetical protein [Thalassospira alkalitolerans]|uniref:Uncharacterized protein n=1 Tax=Thalassospira alkalitolerans TaxID=1293890 RepID=A0A1Y2LI71_9PROT|nr:hypothetical protein [Thalassospira alkalitolerans]OSQ49723.1 hypothetical protein TALK_04445 [Thalassospira alkalitolerans]
MLSFSKILFTALIVVVVWQGFKLFNRAKQVSAQEQPKQTRHAKQAKSQKHEAVAHDLVKCPKCGVYHADGSAHVCDR